MTDQTTKTTDPTFSFPRSLARSFARARRGLRRSRRPAALLGALAAALALHAAPAAAGDALPGPATAERLAPEEVLGGEGVAVAGLGIASAPANRARVTAHFASEAASAAVAAQKLDAQIEAARIAALDAGAAEAGVAARSLSAVQTTKSVFKDDRGDPIRGYQALAALTVDVGDLGALGGAIDALEALGASRIEPVSFYAGQADLAAALDVARADAFAMAEASARRIGGERLGGLDHAAEEVEILRGGFSGSDRATTFAKLTDRAGPLSSAPTVTVRVSIRARWTLDGF